MMALEWLALSELFKCQPTSLAGVTAVLEHLDKPEFLLEDPDDQTGKTVLSGSMEGDGELAKAYMGVLAAAMRKIGTEQPDDPILAVIAEHREAVAWHVAAAEAYGGMRPGAPGYAEAGEADADACERWADSVN
jgi:hypothetical protein